MGRTICNRNGLFKRSIPSYDFRRWLTHDADQWKILKEVLSLIKDPSYDQVIEILPAHKNKELDLEQVVQGAQLESAIAMAMRVVILREGLAMEALSISYL